MPWRRPGRAPRPGLQGRLRRCPRPGRADPGPAGLIPAVPDRTGPCRISWRALVPRGVEQVRAGKAAPEARLLRAEGVAAASEPDMISSGHGKYPAPGQAEAGSPAWKRSQPQNREDGTNTGKEHAKLWSWKPARFRQLFMRPHGKPSTLGKRKKKVIYRQILNHRKQMSCKAVPALLVEKQGMNQACRKPKGINNDNAVPSSHRSLLEG